MVDKFFVRLSVDTVLRWASLTRADVSSRQPLRHRRLGAVLLVFMMAGCQPTQTDSVSIPTDESTVPSAEALAQQRQQQFDQIDSTLSISLAGYREAYIEEYLSTQLSQSGETDNASLQPHQDQATMPATQSNENTSTTLSHNQITDSASPVTQSNPSESPRPAEGEQQQAVALFEQTLINLFNSSALTTEDYENLIHISQYQPVLFINQQVQQQLQQKAPQLAKMLKIHYDWQQESIARHNTIEQLRAQELKAQAQQQSEFDNLMSEFNTTITNYDKTIEDYAAMLREFE